jgi:hypothetical protein
VEVPETGKHFKHYPNMGIEEWHKANGVFYGGQEEEEQDTKKRKRTNRKGE